MRPERKRTLPPPIVRAPDWIAGATCMRPGRAGTTPTSTPVPRAITIVNSSTVPLMSISAERVVKRSTKATSRSSETLASSRPSAPPMSASSVLSVSSCRNRRQRPAPSAARIAISRSRRTMRARSRLATLAATISSTNAAAPTSTRSVGLKPRVSSPRRESGMAV